MVTPEEPLDGAWRFIAPSNLVTYGSLLFALLSIHFAAQGSLHLMAACWGGAAIADNFDGAFARLFKRNTAQQEFGHELDGLADAVSFGLAPLAGLSLLLPAPSSLFFGLAAFCYLLCLLTRLGHYNVAHRRGQAGFVGLPSTEAALALATFLLWPPALPYVGCALGVLGVLMVAPIPIARPRGLAQVALFLWLLAVPLAHLARQAGWLA